MVKHSRKPAPSPERLRAAQQDESAAHEVVGSAWDSCREFATHVAAHYGIAWIQELQHCYNNGNGSCQLHALSHGVGYMPRTADTLPEEQAACMRDVVASAALCYISQGRFRSVTAFSKASIEDQRLGGVDIQVAIKRAQLLEVAPRDSHHKTRGSASSPWLGRMVERLRHQYMTPGAQLPSMALLLFAELENVNIVVLRRNEDVMLQLDEFDAGTQIAFTPHAGIAERTVFVQHSLAGRETDCPATVMHVNKESRTGMVLGQWLKRVPGNHYVYLHHPSDPDPPIQTDVPGTAEWFGRMSEGMDRMVVHARAGTPSELRHTQQQQQQQQKQPQQGNRPSQSSQEQDPESTQEEQQSQAERKQQQQKQQQSRQSCKSNRSKEAKKRVNYFELQCCMCEEVLMLPPERPGTRLSKHAREAHGQESAQPLITQIQELCAQPSVPVIVPQGLVKWAELARCCKACNGLMSEPASQCVNCRRSVQTSSQHSNVSNRSQDSMGSNNNSSNDSVVGGSDTSSDGSQSDDGIESNHSHDDDARQQQDDTPPAQKGPRQNPYAKRASTANAETTASKSHSNGRTPSTTAEPSMQPTWTQNDADIAAVLDSFTPAEAVTIRNITSARKPRSSRQCRQFATVLTWVMLLCKHALDARRESVAATAAGAGCTQARQAELSVSRAAKLLHFIPVLAFGRQMQGKGTKPKDRMDALYNGTFAGSLRKYIDAHRITAETEEQGVSKQQLPRAKPNSFDFGCPVSDADMGWTDSDRHLHESCAELAGQRGGVAQAARKLEAREQHAPADEATQQVLQSKHPLAGSRPDVTDSTPDVVRAAAREALRRLNDRQENGDEIDTAVLITGADVRVNLSKSSAGKAAGPDGLRVEHLWLAMKGDVSCAGPQYDSAEEDRPDPDTMSFADVTAEVFTVLLNEPTLLPDDSWRLLRAANLCGLGDKRRPVACASVWRRQMASIAARKLGPKLGPVLQQLSQLGCGVASGVEHVATTTRVWQQTLGTVIQLDCANAFNSVDRLAIIRGLERFSPELLPYFEAVYCGATMPEMRAELRKCDGAQRDAVYITLSELGCQQGDPLGPLLFAVAIAHALNPLDECDAAGTSDSASDTGQAATDSKIGPHTAYLDDLNLLVNRIINQQVVNRVLITQNRLKAIGLRTNMTKSLAVAQKGHTFSDDEREALESLGIPFVDASTAEHEQGFITVGVPVGTKRYVEEQLRSKLMEKSLWRLAWQLAGMAETCLQAAMIIFRGSFTRRFGYVARNVDPKDSAVWLSGYDGICAWTFERMLQLHGAASASDIQQQILAACLAGDCHAASNPPDLVMLSAGPAGLEDVPLKIARLSAGGANLSNVGASCEVPYVAQLQVTLQSSIEQLLTDTEQAPHGFAEWDAVKAYHDALHTLATTTDLPQRQMKRGVNRTLLQWVLGENPDDLSSDQMAFQAVFAAPMTTDDIDMTDEQNEDDPDQSTAPLNTTNAVQRSESHSSSSDVDATHRNKFKGLQRRLMSLVKRRDFEQLTESLQAAGHAGRLVMAQLRSQRAPFAMAWLGQTGLAQQMSTVETATMLLNSVAIEPWNLQGSHGAEVKCAFCGLERPTANHIMGCARQHIRGHNAVHTGQKCCVQGLLRSVCGFRCHEILNENRTMFTVPTGKQKELQADTALIRFSLSLCGDQLLAQQGVVFDSSVTAATAKTYMQGVKSNAAISDGHAAASRERVKHGVHDGRYNRSRWKFVPFVQEAHGRLGKEATQMLGFIAEHAAQRSGGAASAVAEKRSRILVTLKSRLSTSLAKQMAQRIFGHVRGSAVHGQYSHPISALLSLSKTADSE